MHSRPIVRVLSSLVFGCLWWALTARPVSAALLVASDSTTAGDSDVLAYDANGNPLGSYLAGTAGVLGAPMGIAFGPDGNLYIADAGSSAGAAVWRFNPGSATLTPLVAPGAGGLVSPTALAFDSSGNLFVAGSDGVFEYDANGNLLHGGAFIASGVGGLVSPDGLAFDSAGDLYVADAGSGPGTVSGQVLEYTSGGTLLQTINAPGANGLDSATALTFENGNLFVANATAGIGSSSVLEYGPSGNFIGTFATVLTAPTALAFDALGNLFVADANAATNVVYAYDDAGNPLGTFIGVGSDGLSAPAGLAFSPTSQPAPEPSTLALFSMAAAALALSRRGWRNRR
ncbi:MAG TPA: NHL repeat-containing protein [Pirellulales bacterium]|nr:NHL repeat-containing protein [Pirellulales bacterium]